ncbi:MAG: DUF2007 domain-containing protein [Planctomycetota bacterium]
MADNFVTIEHFENPINADNAKFTLQAAGIDALLLDRHLPMPMYGNILGTVKLQVRQQDVDRALSIIEPLSERHDPDHEPRDRTEPLVDDDRCLRCGEFMAKTVNICGICGWSYGK